MRNKKKIGKSVSKLNSATINTVIGVDTFLKGDIQGESIIRIDGTIEGNLNIKQGIILGEKSKIIGNIESDYVIIHGQIKGNINSKELIIKSSGNVNGDIITDIIEIEMGGKYSGNLKINTEQQQPKKTK